MAHLINRVKIIILIAIFFVFAAGIKIIFLPIVIDSSEYSTSLFTEKDGLLSVNKTSISPSVCIYLHISNDDLVNSDPSDRLHKVIYTEDTELIDKTLDLMLFKRQKGDMCTVTSEIIIVSNNKVVFKSAIDLSSDHIIGLQNEEFGWSEAVNSDSLRAVISQYNIYWNPVLFLN